MNENEKKAQEAPAEEAEKQEELSPEDLKKKREELQKQMREQVETARAKNREANEAISQGKGRLRLETPILAGDTEITELVFDFMSLTGMEYIDAMDTDPNAQQIYRIT